MNAKPLNIAKALSPNLIAILGLSLFLAIPRQTQACGPFFSDAIFVYTRHPDFPLERYAQGQLGVLQTSYARSYFVAAYRALTNAPFTANEQTALKSLWDDRLGNVGQIDDSGWIKTWIEARKKVSGAGEPGDIRAFRNRDKPHEYESYLNCQQDAFETAAATLTDRIARYGADNPAVRDWVAAQDKVFANCGEGKHIPEPPAAGLDGWLGADRAYQIAAANFYAGNFDGAVSGFDQISRDPQSPWQGKVRYLAARSLIRKASLMEKEEDGKPALAEAETRLNAIVRDKTADSKAAARLLNLARLRLHPEAKLHELADAISKTGRSVDLKQDVWDYTLLLDKFLGDENIDTSKRPLPAEVRTDDMTDWIVTFQDESPDAATHAAQRWEQTHALPWLVVALVNADGKQSSAAPLLNEAARIDRDSPAFSTVAFHRVRLLNESGRASEARVLLDGILSGDRSRIPASAINVFISQRMALAQNLEEFLQNASRVPAALSDNSDGRELPDEPDEQAPKETRFLFDTDAADIMNRAMPVSILRQAAGSRVLAQNLKRDVTQAAFLRAALIDDRETANQSAVLLGELYPQLKPLLTGYQRAATPEARRFAAAYLSLKFPGLRPYVTAGVGRTSELKEIDSFRDNWWCAAPTSASARLEGEDPEQAKAPLQRSLQFLADHQAIAAGQLSTLQSFGTGPNYLCRAVIEFATKSPADARLPEALHLAVKSTRYGCTDKETGRWSKAAFDLLHRRYPNTSWARDTKYWFKD